MNKSISIKLIDGLFDPNDANDLLLSILAHKIAYHERKNLGSKEKFGHPDPQALNRIDELKTSRTYLLQFLKGSDADSQNISIQAEINLQINTK